MVFFLGVEFFPQNFSFFLAEEGALLLFDAGDLPSSLTGPIGGFLLTMRDFFKAVKARFSRLDVFRRRANCDPRRS